MNKNLKKLVRVSQSPVVELCAGSLMIVIALVQFAESVEEELQGYHWHHVVGVFGIFLVLKAFAMLLEGVRTVSRAHEKKKKEHGLLVRATHHPLFEGIFGLVILIAGVVEAIESAEGASVLPAAWAAGYIILGAAMLLSCLESLRKALEAYRHIVARSKFLSHLEPVLEKLHRTISRPAFQVYQGTFLLGIGAWEQYAVTFAEAAAAPHHLLLVTGSTHLVRHLPKVFAELETIDEGLHLLEEAAESEEPFAGSTASSSSRQLEGSTTEQRPESLLH